jgi:hypothetical protein
LGRASETTIIETKSKDMSDEQIARELIHSQPLKLLATESIRLEKVCCQIKYQDGASKLFVLDVDDWFAQQCAASSTSATSESALQQTNQATQFFAQLYWQRFLAKLGDAQVSVVSYRSILSDLTFEWLHKHGESTMVGIFRTYSCGSWCTLPREMLQRRAQREWQLVKESVAQYGVDRWAEIVEIRLGCFNNGVRRLVVNNAVVQRAIDRETEEEWQEGMQRIERGFNLFLQGSGGMSSENVVTQACDWLPKVEMITAE